MTLAPAAGRRARRLAAACLLLAALLAVVACTGGGDPPAPPGATPETGRGLSLPDGCTTLEGYRIGDAVIRAGEPAPAVFVASECFAQAAATAGLVEPALLVEWELRGAGEGATEAAREVRMELRPVDGSGPLRWEGEIRYPGPGAWRGRITVAGRSTPIGTERVAAADPALLAPASGGTAALYRIAVAAADGSSARYVWDADDRSGIGWLAGPERVIFVPAPGVLDGAGRDRRLLVAGDPATGTLEPLLAVEGTASVYPAPDGRAIVVRDADDGEHARWRYYDAAAGEVRALDLGAARFASVAWAPDSSSFIAIGDGVRVFSGEDGRELLARPNGVQSGAAWWSPDSRYAFIELTGSSTLIWRYDAATARITEVVDATDALRASASGRLAVRPDGQGIAFAWWNSLEDAHRLALLPSTHDFTGLAMHTLVSHAGDASQPNRWLGGLAWSPDGERIAYTTAGLRDTPGAGVVDASAGSSDIRIIEAATGEERVLRSASDGWYLGTPRWSADGSLLYVSRPHCVPCSPSTFSLDVIDAESGDLVESIEHGRVVVTADRRHFFVGAPGGLHVLDATEDPRLLLRVEGHQSPHLAGAVSPSRDRVAFLAAPNRMAALAYAVPAGGGTPSLLALEGGAQQLLPDASHTLVYVDGWAVQPAAGEPRAVPAFEDLVALRDVPPVTSPDGARLAYWAERSGEQGRRLVIAPLEGSDDAVSPPSATDRRPLVPEAAWSADSTRVAYVHRDELVVVDAATGEEHRVDLDTAGIGRPGPDPFDPPAAPEARWPEVQALAWSRDGASISLVANGGLWRLDLQSGAAEVRAQPPIPGAFAVEVALARSPDGRSIAAGTPFGVWTLDERDEWTLVSQAGLAPLSRLHWSPDGARLVYEAAEAGATRSLGIVVAAAGGSDARYLVRALHANELRLLGWLPDGRVAFTVAPVT